VTSLIVDRSSPNLERSFSMSYVTYGPIFTK